MKTECFAETEVLCKHLNCEVLLGWGSASTCPAALPAQLGPWNCHQSGARAAWSSACPGATDTELSSCWWVGGWLKSWELQCSEPHGVAGIGQGEVLGRSLKEMISFA